MSDRALGAMASKVLAAVADRDLYRDAVARYGNHDFLCDARHDSEAVCVCGWSDFKRVHLHGR